MNGTRVLIVDDIKENIYSMKELLIDVNLKLFEANSGEKCLEMLLNEDIDIVLLDIQMPGMDGYETAQYIRQNSRTKNIPIIFITAANHSNVIDLKAYDSGAIDIMYKPVIKDILISKVMIFKEIIETRKKLENQVIELRELNANNLRLTNEIKMLASTDFLTNLPNRRTLDIELKKYFKSSVRNQTSISVLMIDIDNFKSYNDNFGHQQGDVALKLTADAIKESLDRPQDVAGRYGGEEFLVLLPETDIDGAKYVAEQIRLNVLNKKIETCVPGTLVSVSIGVSTIIPTVDDDYFAVVELADEALYIAKEKGKNRFECKVK